MRRPVGHRGRPREVDRDVQLPIRAGHLVDRRKPADAGIVDDDIQPAERREGRLDQGFRGVPIRDIAGIGDRLAAQDADLVDDRFSRRRIRPLAAYVAAQVVDHDSGACRRQGESVRPPQSSSRAGDDRDLSVKQPFHLCLVLVVCPLARQSVGLTVMRFVSMDGP